MKPELILRSDALDILFENRNKLYGAYLLRRNYSLHLYAGISAMALLVAALFIWSNRSTPRDLGGILAGPIIELPDVHLVEPPPPATPPPPPVPPAPRPPRATVNYDNIIVVPDDLSTPIPDLDQITNSVISNVTTDGPADDRATLPPPAVDQPAGSAQVPPAEEPPAILTTASVMPSFPGGTTALQRWLSRNLRPQDEQEPGQRIRVVVRFAVSASGEIEQVMITQYGGEAFDREVLRVINKMPKWEPGQQNGRPVAVWFSIPVIFEMPEQ